MDSKSMILSSFIFIYFTIGILGAHVISENGQKQGLTQQDDLDQAFDKNLDIENKFNSDTFDDEYDVGILRQAKQTPMPTYKTIRTGVGCGYLRMKAGEVYTIQSSNFKVGSYFNNEACVWRFFGHHCIVAAKCPCSDIPQSASCLKDYLKISDEFLFNQRFCGDLKPAGSYQSATNNLRIRFRSDAKETATGFICYVYCSAPGQEEYMVPSNATCPTPSITL